MATTYHPYKIALTDGQKKKLQKAYVSKTAVALRVKPEQIGCSDELLLTATQISRVKKTAAAGKGLEFNLSQTQIQSTAQRGGNLFSAMLGLARPLIKPALGALTSAGLSFGAEKVLKKIFRKGFGPKEIEVYNLVQLMTPGQKKEVERHLVGQGFVRGGAAQYSGFLGLLACIGVPLAIGLVKKILGKGLLTHPPRPRCSPQLPPPPRGRGMQMRPPPFYGTWDDYGKRKKKFKDVPLSNIDLENWCDYLGIPIKGIFSRNEKKPLAHSRCIINLDDYGSLGTHWVCCSKNGAYEYFDSFGLPPPLEWEKEIFMLGKKHFFRNDDQIQWEQSVRCGYYCLLFLNERKKGTSFANILKMFTNNVRQNESIVKNYFFMRYTKMEVFTPNVKGSEKVVITKNNRKLFKVKCASCGITKTRFLPGN